MNINLHIKEKFWNLDLQRTIRSMQAERVVDLVCQKLFKFGIDLNKHILETVNDGASVMVKYGQGPIKLDGGLRHSSIWGPLRPPDRWIYPVYIIWIQIYVINSIV